MNGLYVLALAAGMFSALQSTVNTRLAQYVGGPIMSSTISVIITTISLVLVVLIARTPMPVAATLSTAPWWAWTGGAIGAAFLTTVIYSIQGLGVASAISLVIAGQIVTSIVMDQLGVHGGTPIPITPIRCVGAVLLIAGVWLINKH
jgi:transporter family-2 protein